MDLLSCAEFLWLIVVGVFLGFCLDLCVGRAVVEFGWLPVVVGCLTSALVIKAVGWLFVVGVFLGCALVEFGWLPIVVDCLTSAPRWPISRSVDENAETTLLEAWANRISLGNEFEILEQQLLKLGALLTSARGFRTNSSSLEELVEELQQLKYQAENLLDELDYYRLEDQIQQRGGAQEKGNYISKSSAATSSSGFWLTSRSILSTLKGMSGLVSLPKTYFSRINLSRRMNELAKQLQKSEEKVRYALLREVDHREALGLTAWNTKIRYTEATKLHQTSSFLTEPIVFGRDQERYQLMNLLTNEESAMVGQVPVIAIVGSGGVGKTTLAQLVFTNPKIRSYFEVRLWIFVSTQFDSLRLTREMLEDVCGNKYNELSNLNELQKILKDKLESKRFLLVLDDMWEDEDKSQWDLMVAPLNYCRVRGSIILVTTRNQSVAKLVGARDIIYLQGLDDNAFSSFFSTCIFNDSYYGGNRRLGNIGQQIANKLKGNPLAAKTVSAQLKKNLNERFWIEIRDNEEWKSQSGPNDILYALQLNYEHMPIHLQRCFSCCAIFPEDHPFTCKELVYLWMAQGFLDVRSERKKMEDIGSAYFNDLFNFGFFQIKQSTDGLVYYTFNDFIHDLAHSVAFKECLTIDGTKHRQILPIKECLTIDGTKHRQILPTRRHLSIFGSTERSKDAIKECLTIAGTKHRQLLPVSRHLSIIGSTERSKDAIKECLTIDGTKHRQILPTIRHLSIFGCTERSKDEIVAALACLKGENLSTIIIWDGELPSGVCQSISDLLKKTKFLRAMRLKLGSMVQQHNFIQNFVSLRYLSLNLQILLGSVNTSSYTLPREICRLYHLEVFEIEGGEFLDELPNNFSDLISLRYFIVEGKLHSKICGVGNLTSLQELNYFNVQENIGFEIEQLGSLKEIGGSLQISNLENVKSKEEASKARLAKKENLDVLYLKWNPGEQETENVLEGLRPNTNLKSLTIVGYGGVAPPLWLYSSLIFLESLTLKDCKAWELLPPIGELEFLKHLELSGMAVREIGSQCYGTRQSMKFPSLEKLKIKKMSDLEKWVWSDQLQQFLCFKTLKELTIRDCPKLVDLPFSGSATSEVLERFPSLEVFKIRDCPLILQIPPLP